MQDVEKVRPLTKVSLKLSAVVDHSPAASAMPEIDFEFVCGIATEGLTAFEMTLSDKAPGDRVRIEVAAAQAQAYFEHLFPQLVRAFKSDLPPHLNVEITAVEPVTDRELVRALADKNEGGGCAGDCGCGCG